MVSRQAKSASDERHCERSGVRDGHGSSLDFVDYHAVRLAYGLRDAGDPEPGLVLHMVFSGRGRAPRWRLTISTGEHRSRYLSAVVIEPDRGRRILGRFRGLFGNRSQYHVARQLSREASAHDAHQSGVDYRPCFLDADNAGPRIRLDFRC